LSAVALFLFVLSLSPFHPIRKSVKAAMVLLPLLGITNALVMIKAPLDRSVVEFAMWSYSSHFLTSFQGFFVALLYCFLNGEVSCSTHFLSSI
jgi:hypothetical protein